jgi:hypothetical protein
VSVCVCVCVPGIRDRSPSSFISSNEFFISVCICISVSECVGCVCVLVVHFVQ